MLKSNNPEIDIEKLLEKVDLELKIQHRAQKSVGTEDALIEEQANDPYSWSQLAETLNVAEQNANAGAEVTSMLHYRGIMRKIARFFGKVTIYLGRVITIPQRNFNSAILHSLRITLDGIRDMNRNTARLQSQVRGSVQGIEKKLGEVEEKLCQKSALIDYLKSALTTQERRVSILLEELRRQVPKVDGQGGDVVLAEKVPDILDPLYLAFENQFRGSREEIRQRLVEYLPIMKKSDAGIEGRKIIDIGCGRGEWLAILKEEGLEATGIDLNDILVQDCVQQDLEAHQADGLSYLRSLADNSVGAITAFHLIEHLDLETRIALFDESVRVLKPGGVAIFETPNPRNLLVGSCDFWADPTHLRPLYPETHQFLMEYRGFCKVELLFLHPPDEEHRLPSTEAPQLATRLDEVFSCPRDYTVIGYKV